MSNNSSSNVETKIICRELEAGTLIPFLFLDPENRPNNVVLCAETAQKEPTPAIPKGDLDSSQYCTVVFDSEKKRYRMWYGGWDSSNVEKYEEANGKYKFRPCYAESDDGKNWEKPNLGIAEHKGSTKNNYLAYRSLHPKSVLLDEQEQDPRKRFKSVHTWSGNQRITYSEDGLHWYESEEKPIKGPGLAGFHESMCFFTDPNARDPEKRFMLYSQASNPTKPTPINTILSKPMIGNKKYSTTGSNRRKIGVAFGKKETSLKIYPELVLDPDDALEEQIHSICVLPYEGYYLALYEFTRFNTEWRVDLCDMRLAVSRDGLNFNRIDNQVPVIPLGKQGSWDDGSIVSPNQPIKIGNELVIYYAGGNREAGLCGVTDSDYGRIYNGNTWELGRATIPYNTISCIRVSQWQLSGSFRSDPFIMGKIPPQYLEVNFSSKPVRMGAGDPKSAVKLSIVDEKGNHLAECSKAEHLNTPSKNKKSVLFNFPRGEMNISENTKFYIQISINDSYFGVCSINAY